jgi:hypothetical protein
MESISRQYTKELEKGIVLIHKRLERRKYRITHSALTIVIQTKDLPKQIVYRKTHVQFCDQPFLKIKLYGGDFGQFNRNA